MEWLAGLDDVQTIHPLKALRATDEEKSNQVISHAEQKALEQGLDAIANGRVHSHESVKEGVRKKFPNLFK
ncbi:hypothetical protein C7460_10984 [Marinoscillum furvescens DSM 4134]|uniref:Uncharacterized protein n=2 Tax=Marinoscillum furvescens TaxID=1026 RepID=A0A3D9L3C1_MARFU|nr:hypothetical protein C7460_10984 [Marinoscillum furvescens DSM 4134]